MDIATNRYNTRLALHLTCPESGSDVRGLLREFAELRGVKRVATLARLSRVLLIDFDANVIAAETLVERARRRWRFVQRVGTRSFV